MSNIITDYAYKLFIFFTKKIKFNSKKIIFLQNMTYLHGIYFLNNI